MGASTDMGLALLKTFGMLFIVLALLILLLYAVRRFSSIRIGKKGPSTINVLAMHHFSPREKVALLEVKGKNVLIGITPQSITPLASFAVGKRGSGGFEQTVPEQFDSVLKRSADGMAGPEGSAPLPEGSDHET